MAKTGGEIVHERAIAKAQRIFRRMHVGEWLLQGYTHEQMMEALTGMELPSSRSTVTNDIREVKREWKDRFTQAYMAHASQQLAVLDALETKLMRLAMAEKANLWAIDRLLGVLDRKAKLLGLDAPSKVEVSLKIEAISIALQGTLAEMGVDPDEGRRRLAIKLRELEAIPTAISS